MVAEAKRADVPLLFASSVCPKEVYPPADPLQFCTTAFAANYDSRAALAFVKETAKEPVKIGFSAMAIPLSRGEMEFAEEQSQDAGHDAGRTRRSFRRRRPTTRRSRPSSRRRAPTGCSRGRRG